MQLKLFVCLIFSSIQTNCGWSMLHSIQGKNVYVPWL